LGATILLTTKAGGIPPLFLATYGGVDMIRDNITLAQSGQLVITALVTADCTIARPAQIQSLTNAYT
jgi:hypothetical protein